MVISRCAEQMMWMQAWLDEVTIEHNMPDIIRGDSRGAIALTKNTRDHGKVKYIDIHHHYIQELMKSGEIAIERILSTENAADLFTKPLSCDYHHQFLHTLNIN